LTEYREQDEWLRKELDAAKTSGTKQIVIFQHHPYFLQEASEPDRYENIPLERRKPLLDLFRNYGVRYIFAGHYHQNGYARDGQIEMIVTAPVGKALGKDGSGIRLAMLRDNAIEHHYYDFGFLPDKLDELK
jgi:3',5'-cyclic AMP phosphodiesterase CpdA